MYDIASLTKVVVTTTLVEKLVEGDFPSPLNLDAPIERYLPEWTKRAAIGMAAQSDRAQFDDAHFRASAVQGILADVNEQARDAWKDFC